MRWCPTRHTVAALGVGGLAAAFSTLALAFPRDSLAYATLLWALIFGLCGFALPWAYVLLIERGTPAALGIRRERWAVSLLLSLLFAMGSLYGMFQKVDPASYGIGRLARAAFTLNVGGLFELFLYYGFIHLRLREAFGALPAIVGTAAIYSLWHIGTELPMHAEPLRALGMLFVVGLLCQSLFATTYNVLVIWPVFFTAGVLHDFVVNLDLPAEIYRSLAWPLAGWAMAVGLPVWMLRVARRRPRSDLERQLG